MPERPVLNDRVVRVDPADHGLLWLINTTVFHPRGFALGWSPSEKVFQLMGDGTERYCFTEDGAEKTADTDDKFRQVEELFTEVRRMHAALKEQADA